MAKVSEARDPSTFQILDHPTVPTYPARPDKRSLAIFGLCGGLALAFAWIILPLAWRNRIDPTASG
jgi:LPS O-antigen subunit length determinant protein (WzzB/FepE family)